MNEWIDISDKPLPLWLHGMRIPGLLTAMRQIREREKEAQVEEEKDEQQAEEKAHAIFIGAVRYPIPERVAREIECLKRDRKKFMVMLTESLASIVSGENEAEEMHKNYFRALEKLERARHLNGVHRNGICELKESLSAYQNTINKQAAEIHELNKRLHEQKGKNLQARLRKPEKPKKK